MILVHRFVPLQKRYPRAVRVANLEQSGAPRNGPRGRRLDCETAPGSINVLDFHDDVNSIR